jgi:hypothetical protein
MKSPGGAQFAPIRVDWLVSETPRRRTMKTLALCFAVFMAGVVASANLTCLVGTSQNYEATWVKFAVACSLAVVFSAAAAYTKDR